MTWNDDITESFRLCRGEYGVHDVYRPPVGKEVPLLVARPGLLAKIEIIVDVGGEFEVFVYTTRGTCWLK